MYYSAGPFMRPPAHKTTPKKGKSGLVGWSETGHPIDYSFIRPLHQVVFLAYGENVVVPFPSIVSSLGKVMLNLRARHHVSHAALNYLSKEFHTTCDVCYTWKLNKTTRKGEIVLPRLYWCRAEGQKD